MRELPDVTPCCQINDLSEFTQLITNLAHCFDLNLNGQRRRLVEVRGATLTLEASMDQPAILEWFMKNMLDQENEYE